jgi:hypothetical protein
MSKRAYTKGVVIIECEGCKNRHLIADHLDWMDEYRSIEDVLKAKGEQIRRVAIADDFTMSFVKELDEKTKNKE